MYEARAAGDAAPACNMSIARFSAREVVRSRGERLPVRKSAGQPRLDFLLHPAHRVRGDSNALWEATLRLQLVDFCLAKSGHIDDLRQTQNPNRRAPRAWFKRNLSSCGVRGKRANVNLGFARRHV